MENAIALYGDAIDSGAIIAGKYIKNLYRLIRAGLEEKRWFYDTRKASNVIAYIERFCHHNKGPLAPGRIKLELWQKALLSLIFGIVDAEGKRQFTEVVIIVGRKCGKTLIAAGITSYVVYVVGEFGSEVYFLAPKLDQSDLCYSAFEFNVNAEPALKKRTRSTKYKGLFVEERNTTVKKLAFSDRKSDGYNPMLFTADEISSWAAARGLRQWEVMISGTGARREPLGVAISSAGYENDGIYDELFKRGTAFLNGDSRETHLLPVFYTIDDPEKWDDIQELHKSLPQLGISISYEFIQKEIDIAHQSLSKRSEFLCKYCNIKSQSSAAWLSAKTIKKSFPPNHYTLGTFARHYCLCGVDLSITTDLSAAVVLVEHEGIVYYFTHFWLPETKLEEAKARDQIPYDIYIKRGFLSLSQGNAVDYHDITNWFTQLVNVHKLYVQRVGYDKYCATYFVQEMKSKPFHMESVGQGYNLTGVINDVESMLKDGKLQCGDDNDLMKLHMLDSALKFDNESNKRRLVKQKPNRHIDGMAALLDAMCMRHNYYEQLGKLLRNEGKPLQNEGK